MRYVVLWLVCAGTAGTDIAGVALAGEPTREERVAAALGVPVPRPGSANPDADRARRAKVALALACDVPDPANARRVKLPQPMPPGEMLGPRWRASYESALRESSADRKPLFCLVTSPATCPSCRRLDKTLTDATVLQDLGGFVPVKIDPEQDPTLTQKLGTKIIPFVVIAGPDGKVIVEHEGELSVADLRKTLQRVK